MTISDTQLVRPLLTVAADESDLFRKVQGRVVVVPAGSGQRWIDGTERVIAREIESVRRFMKSGKTYPVEGTEESGREAIARLTQTLRHFQLAKKGYPKRIYPEFLGWNRPDGRPHFMTLSWGAQEFSIKVEPGVAGRDRMETKPYLHPLLAVQYVQAVDNLLALARERGFESMTISARFSGSIPGTVRRQMEVAEKSGLFDKFYLVAEAPKIWEVDRVVRARTDPIVMASVRMPAGVPDMFMMIGIFDPTPIERAAAEQFVLDPYFGK